MKNTETKIHLDNETFVRVLSDRLAQGVNTRVRIHAKAIVASPWNPNKGYALGDLADSIRTDGRNGKYQTVAGGVMGPRRGKVIKYALAQEFGRPDMPKYSFRPYMRPAASKATSREDLNKVKRDAVEAAIIAARINK